MYLMLCWTAGGKILRIDQSKNASKQREVDRTLRYRSEVRWNVQYTREAFMTPSVHRAKRVTAAVRAVELLSLPLHPSSSLFVRFAYLPTRDQTQIRFSRPRSSATAICSLKQILPASGLAGPVECCSILAFFLWQSYALEDAISRVVGRSFSHLENKKNRGKPHVFPEYNFRSI